jgi:peroxiredoxin
VDLPFDVVDLPETDHVAAGEPAPDFERPLVGAEYWEDATLSELTEAGPVLLVFHPMNGSFPATYVWNEIRDRGWADLLTVVGVTIGTPYAHRELIAARELGDDYRLFSDPANDVAEAYGVVHDLDGMAGVSEPRPATFLVDADGVVRDAWVASEWPEFPDYDALEGTIREFVA